MISEFNVAATPHIHFGAGKRSQLKQILAGYGRRVLLVTGGRSFDQSSMCGALLDDLQQDFDIRRVKISGEPSPQLVDSAVAGNVDFSPHTVVAIGGGSAVDAGKAIAGLLPSGHSVMDYLEGVGAGRVFAGPSTPFIAVPTTAGTGGETSKNAVLSVQGEQGFKKSFRHETLVARHIVLDPKLTLSCPPDITAACGMDAFTQLLESYVSSNANPLTDALAESGMVKVRDSLLQAVEQGDNLGARADMLYASSLSGLTLANAGLGSVHGLASPLGAFFPIPHGVVCGTLLFEASRMNIDCMREREPDNPGLTRYAAAGRIMLENPLLSEAEAIDGLLALLKAWTERLRMPLLSDYGIGRADIPRIVAGSRGNSMKTNPILLSDAEIAALADSRIEGAR